MDFYIFNNCINKGSVSGTDRRAFELSKIFKKWGHAVHLFIPTNARGRYQYYEYDLIFTSSLDMTKNGLSIFLTYLWRGIKGCIAQKKIPPHSVIYSSSDGLADFLPAFYMKLCNRKLPWITGLHLIAPNPFKGFRRAFTKGIRFPTIRQLYYHSYQRMAIFVMKYFAEFVTVSNNIDKKFLIKKGISAGKIMVVYGGVNFEEIEGGGGEEKYDASFIGRIHPQKGIPDLLEIWRKVCRKKKDAKLAMIGQLEISKKEIHRLGLDKNIELLGFLDGEKKFKALKSSKIFLLPSYYEGCSLATCEAMACGLPVLAYELPMLREVYPRGMVRVPVGDVEKLSEEIVNLLFNNQRWEKLAGEAKEISKEFDWEKNAKKILERLTKNIHDRRK